MQVRVFTKAIIFCLALSFTAISTAADKKTTAKAEDPAPFGLVFGKTTKDEALIILKNEGGTITNSGNRTIKDDISNPYVEGYFLNGVNIDGVTVTKAWFLNGVLMELTYELSGSFQPFNDQLKSKYGNPSKSNAGFGGEAHSSWLFKSIELSLDRPFMGSMTMDYSHTQLYRESQSLDSKVYAEATKKMGQKQKGF